MRSRFTAHVARDYGYLHRTYLTSSQQPYVDEGPTPANVWTRLTIHSHTLSTSPDLAYVEFSAYYIHEDGGEAALQEKSEFRRVNGEWFYIRALRLGPAPFKSTALKVGRNDPCPCGSGKKYKHCCLIKET
jgi:SEC-C motif-containing protein